MFESGRVLWIGIGLLLTGCLFLWLWIRRRGRKLSDSFALLGAGIVLTALMSAGIWMLDGVQLSRAEWRLFALGVFLPVSVLVGWLFNKLSRKEPVNRTKA